jgi:hypothetical protein
VNLKQLVFSDGIFRSGTPHAAYINYNYVFEKLIADIRNGKFSGILSWAPDRLSRNAGDLKTLVDLMDN